MQFRVKLFTEAHPDGRYLAPPGRFADPHVYSDRIAAIGALTDAKAGMRCAGVDTDFVTYLIEEVA